MIKHNKPTLGLNEVKAAERVIKRGWVAQGYEVSAFEDEICSFLGLDEGHTVVVSSGTAALFLAIWALKSKNKRIGVPVYSCTSLRNAVIMAGAIPVYLDSSNTSPNIDLTSNKINDIDILIAPSMFGLPIDIEFNQKFKIIEDVSQSFGSSLNSQKIGLRGDIGITSFYATKLINTGGQGGAIFSKNKNLIDAIRDFREFDNRKDDKYRFNFQMTDIQAAIGRIQLVQFDDFIKKREIIFTSYKNLGLDFLDENNKSVSSVRYRAILKTKSPLKVIKMLSSLGVNSIIPVEKKELLDSGQKYPNSIKLTNTTISLPIYPSLSKLEISKIIDSLKIIFNI